MREVKEVGGHLEAQRSPAGPLTCGAGGSGDAVEEAVDFGWILMNLWVILFVSHFTRLDFQTVTERGRENKQGERKRRGENKIGVDSSSDQTRLQDKGMAQ